MTELKATPGPWEIDHMTSGTARYNIRAKNGPITVNPATAYRLSDAHLIAAAPELYGLLQLMLTHGERCNWFADRGDYELVEEAEKLLSKARGETE